jgi:imidazolonepropionase
MKLIGPFKQLVTMAELPERGALLDHQLQIIPNGGVLVAKGHFQAVGDFEQLKAETNPSSIEFMDQDLVAFPGIIDAHTHICWAGSRADDYAARLSGQSYQEMAAKGGGIWSTVTQTRAATLEQLAELTHQRAQALLKQGITTIEVKSGYGLSVEHELKILQAIAQADTMSVPQLIPTCLAAHMLPHDFDGSEEDYLSNLVHHLLPKVMKQNLTNRIDIFVEKNAFSATAAKNYLLKAKAMGFDLVLHGNQFTSGSVQLANDVDALSIDHLETTPPDEILALSRGNTIPIALPGASIGLAEPFAPARQLLDAGTSLVIASDWNPGSAPMGHLLVQAAILGVAQKLTMAETWSALTIRAARALKLNDRGGIQRGHLADFIAFPTHNYQEILYHQGQMLPDKIWKNGILTK